MYPNVQLKLERRAYMLAVSFRTAPQTPQLLTGQIETVAEWVLILRQDLSCLMAQPDRLRLAELNQLDGILYLPNSKLNLLLSAPILW